jgi:hypothetical protein
VGDLLVGGLECLIGVNAGSVHQVSPLDRRIVHLSASSSTTRQDFLMID